VASARGSEVCTNGVRVLVHPVYDAEQSTPSAREWLFAYRIRIVNERTDGPTAGRTVQLLSRKWTIIDAAGRVREVEGDGVVGQQPVLAPGECFEYASLCPLNTAWGTMEGTYTFRGADGAGFAVGIGRFFLVGK
jgi:ApaG protein